jgi:hypothetical protein
VLRGEVVNLSRIDDVTSEVFFGPLLLGRLRDEKPRLDLTWKRDEAE